MFNSCTFNTIKYNSLCLREAVSPLIEVSGGIRLREPKKKLFKREFFDIIGTKLLFSKHKFNIIGLILLAKQLELQFTGQKLNKLKQDLLLKGIVSYPFKTKQELIGFIKVIEDTSLIVEGKRLISIKSLHMLNGSKLLPLIQYNIIKGSKKIFTKQNNLIHGKKDITEILEILDILDLEE